jgi:hypothetical protein
MQYDPNALSDKEIQFEKELEKIITTLLVRRDRAREGSAEYRMIERQLEGIRHGSQVGALMMEEVDSSGDIYRRW